MGIDAFGLARILQRRVKSLKSVGYSHPPIIRDEGAYFRVGLPSGDRLEVSVRVVPLEEDFQSVFQAASEQKNS